MDINSIPEAFQSKIRLAIISSLIPSEKTFKQVKEATQASDGNLSIHLTRLEESGYITSCKEFVGKKPCTTYSLTEKGREEFKSYVNMLEQLLNQNSSENK